MRHSNVFFKSSISADTANCVIKSSLINHNNSVKLAYFNARSLNMDDKFAELLHVIDSVDFHFIAITETWLKPWISSNSVSIPGFTLLRNDRLAHAGGVAIYIRDFLKWKLVDKSDNSPTESLFIEVLLNGSKILVGVIYNSKGGKVDHIECILASFTSIYQHILIAGDFNINMLDNNYISKSFKNVIASQNLAYLPTDQPTHVCDFHSSASLIDMIITGDVSRIDKFVQLDLSIFDHDFIYLCYSVPCPTISDSSFTYRSYNDVNYDSLCADVLRLDWRRLFELRIVDDKVALLNDYLRYLFDLHIPVKKFVKSRQTSPTWFNANIQTAILERETSYRVWKTTKTTTNRLRFIQSRRAVKKLIRSYKSSYIYKQLDSKLPGRKLWSNIRNIGLLKDTPPITQFSADELNKFFVNSIPSNSSAGSIFVIKKPIPTVANFNFQAVDEIAVLSAISSIKSNAVGHDGIPLKFLKLMIPVILPFVCDIINSCLVDSIFPSQWKISKIIPIAKSAHPKTFNDMRPISVLPVLSKVLEVIMKNQITNCLSTQKLILPLQSGFRSNHSTTTAILKITDDISSFLDDNQVVFLVLLDFSKAFDTLSHEILLEKLKNLFGFSDRAIKLVHNYLTCRSQYVSYSNESSAFINTQCGVPQGSVLGPLLFSIFINDIAQVITHCKYHLYADDLQVYLNSRLDLINHTASQINHDLYHISKWANTNGLVLNSLKSKVLRIYKGKINLPYPHIELNNETIAYTDVVRNLGFMMTCDFKWDVHVNRICSNIYAGLKRLCKFKNCTPIKTKKSLAFSLLISQILYSDIVLGKLDYDTTRRLQVAFNSITRYVYNLSRFDHITPYSKSLLGCTFENYLKYRQCILLFNIIYEKSPDYLVQKVNLAHSKRCVTLIPPSHRSTFRARFFFINGAQTWNSMPLKIKMISNPHQFKRECFNHFASL